MKSPQANPMSRRLTVTAVALLALIAIGIAGYQVLGNMNFVEAVYMTVITLTTVGFSEVHPLSNAGRIFTIGMIIGGVSVVAYAFSSLTQFVVSGEWQQQWQTQRRRRMLNQLTQHIIVCGYGRVGKNVVHELASERLPFVVIDSDPAKVAHLHELGHLALPGNAADEHLLQEARIDRARGLVVCASSDAENVYIVLTARGLRADIPIVARANYEESEAKLRRAGADRVILPFTIAGHRMVSLLVRPEAADFMDEALRVGGTDLLLEQINLAANSVLANQTLAQSELGSKFGVTVLACRQPDGKLETRPGAETILQPEARLIVLGTSDQLRALIELAHGSGARR